VPILIPWLELARAEAVPLIVKVPVPLTVIVPIDTPAALAAVPPPFPVMETLPPPVVEITGVETPTDAVELLPAVPLSVMSLPALSVLIVPPVREMPRHAPVVPVAVAVIAMGWDAPVVEKFALKANPTPAFPWPVMEEVAVTLPAVVKAAVTLIPLPPPVPPMQLEQVTAPLPVKAAPKLRPWLAPVFPPLQLVNVISPVVAGVQAAARETP